ncbi:MAG: hypothetical protein FWC95_00530, partial [Defluviitaleaceae bacterium]|nr:hypothetical protein [Defluviitaleaceae bacterium]
MQSIIKYSKHFEYHSCMEDIIVSICGYLKTEHGGMYLRAWNFNYNVNKIPVTGNVTDTTLGSKISEGPEYALSDIAWYHGLTFIKTGDTAQIDYEINKN